MVKAGGRKIGRYGCTFKSAWNAGIHGGITRGFRIKKRGGGGGGGGINEMDEKYAMDETWR